MQSIARSVEPEEGVKGMSDEKVLRQSLLEAARPFEMPASLHDEVPRHSPRPPRAASGLILVALAGSVLAFGGCVVGPQYVKPDVPANPDWSEKADPRLATGSAPDSTWWKVFNDPTLDQLVETALRQNLSLQVAGLRIMEARARLGLAVGRRYPQVQEVFASATAVGLSEHGPTGALVPSNYWDYQVGFDAAWEADLWGKYRQDVRAEAGNYLATVADYDDVLVSLTAEVARTYAVIRTFEALIEYAGANVALQEEGLRIAEARFRHGATSELDVAQATTLLESTRESIPQLQTGLQQAENALSTLLGQPTGAVRSLLSTSSGIPSAPAQVAVGIPADMLRRRPDVRSAELSAVSQCARIGVAKADLYPRLTLFGTIGTQTTSGAGGLSGHSSFSDLFGANSLFYAFTPQLVLPIFNYGRIENNVRIQDARFQQLLVGYQDTVLRAAQEAEDAMIAFLRAQEAAAFARKASTAAARSVELASIQYREGAVDYQRVLDAQRTLLQEQNTLVTARASIATNLIATYKALGGGWEVRSGQPYVPDSVRIEMQDRTNWGKYFSTPATVTVEGVISNP
jgi:NodT family efflux transporter outer membrane factor (OMF) lipoprotein